MSTKPDLGVPDDEQKVVAKGPETDDSHAGKEKPCAQEHPAHAQDTPGQELPTTQNHDAIRDLIGQLQGSTADMYAICEELDLDPMSDEITTAVDDVIFCCTCCGWWCDMSEEASEDFDHGEWACRDCMVDEYGEPDE